MSSNGSVLDPALKDEADQIVGTLLTYPPDDPYPLFNRLREIAPMHRTANGVWTVATYDLCDEVLRDPRFVRSVEDMTRRQLGDGIDYSRPMIASRFWQFQNTNPPIYQKKRSVYAKFLTPAAVDKLRDEIARNSHALLDEAEKRGEIELVSEFSYGLTLNLICRILGFPAPEGGAATFLDWFRAFGDTFQAVVTEDMLNLADEAMINLNEMMRQQLEGVRREPSDNLISVLDKAEYNGEPLPDDEIIANAILMFAASVGTTADLISNVVVDLLQHPDQWAMVTADPEGMVRNAVEETLRFDSSVTANPPTRLSVEDMEIGPYRIPAGEVVIPLYAAANRDPARFDNPDTFDITREDNRPLSFGGGPHVCPGQHLARVQTQIAVQILATRFPNMKLIDSNPPRRANAAQRGAAELRIRLT